MKMKAICFLPITLVLIVAVNLTSGLSCVGEDGKVVDWFIVYKLPKLEKSANQLIKTGYGYTYLTDRSLNDWTLSSRGINQKNSVFGQTLKPVLESVGSESRSKETISYLAYSDQSPGSKSSSGAHSKGLFAYESKGGFWLSHSVPRFPDLEKEYDYPDTGRNNGQTAICISLDAKDIQSVDNIAHQLLIMRPKIYSKRLLDALLKRSVLWKSLDDEKWIKNDTSSELKIKSKKGMVFTSFSKSSKYPKDMYSGLIANYYKEDLLVQTWRNGAGEKLESDCTDKYKVQNIDRIGLKNFKSDWNTTEDHSKWGITTESDDFTCISDINRMKSQFKRGGGSLCIHSDKVWKVFKKSIEAIEGCPLHPKHRSTTESTDDETDESEEEESDSKTERPTKSKAKGSSSRSKSG